MEESEESDMMTDVMPNQDDMSMAADKMEVEVEHDDRKGSRAKKHRHEHSLDVNNENSNENSNNEHNEHRCNSSNYDSSNGSQQKQQQTQQQKQKQQQKTPNPKQQKQPSIGFEETLQFLEAGVKGAFARSILFYSTLLLLFYSTLFSPSFYLPSSFCLFFSPLRYPSSPTPLICQLSIHHLPLLSSGNCLSLFFYFPSSKGFLLSSFLSFFISTLPLFLYQIIN
jgi:hypothetical protein